MFAILSRKESTIQSRFSGWRRLAAVVSFGVLTTSVVAQPYGLDQRPAVGAFLNNALPRSVDNSAQGWQVVIAFTNLTFDDPVTMVAEPGTNRLYVTGRQGTIHFFENNPATSNKTLFLDLTPVTQGYDDCGLMGFAFHPEFGVPGSPNRGYVYVYYQFSPSPVAGPNRPPSATPGYNRLSRFTVPDGSLIANPASEQVLINQYDRHVWHNGGAMLFGPDGFLYLSNGDEGAANDSYNETQKINASLFSGVLRIDVDMDPTRSHPIRRQPASPATPPAGWPTTYTANYYIPNDNPWLDAGGSILEEFYAIGLRSPHRMTFDPVSGRIWQGDVGQGTREEVNIIEKGGNYQWAYREGNINGPKAKPNPLIGVDKPPVYDYTRTDGNCVIGGYVYRGSEHPSLFGRYIFGDNGSGRIWTLTYNGTNAATVTQLTTMPSGANYTGLSSFGVDQNNELYMLKMGRPSRIYKLARTGTPPPPPPALLSQTGAFTNLATLATAPALVPFTVNAPLWSDGSEKYRWMVVPNNGAPYDATETIGFTTNGSWNFPVGTVLVKHFELGLNETNAAIRKRLETRFLVNGTNGAWYGLTYKWRNDQSDADLLPSSFEETLLVTTPTGIRTQVWYYPSRADCLTCHNANAGTVLGPRTTQLNGDFTYPSTGRTDNQLRTLNHLGLFNTTLNEGSITNLPKSAYLANTNALLEHRIRSYLDANCSHCHRPNGVNAFFDARISTPLESQGIVNGPVANPMGLPNAKVVAPKNLSQSLLHVRDSLQGPGQMPPLARNEVDQQYISLLAQWINSFSVPGGPPAPWVNQDVGPVGLAGSATYTNGTFTVTASGVDIWDAEDSFHFVHQPWEGDVTITARVLSLSNTAPWAIGGVMIRQSLSGESRHAIAALTSQNGFSFTRRLSDGGLSEYTGVAATTPRWVRMARVGNTFTASQSTDGVNWTVVGTTTITMTGPVHVGLAWSANNNGALGNATFDNVTVVGPPTNTLPTISPIANQTVDEDAVAGPLGFTIGDGETAAGALVLSVTSTNTALLPTNNIVLGGSASNRTVTLTPVANQFGLTAVTLTVSDGIAEASTSFVLTVLPVNDLPMVSAITNQTINEDAVAGPLAFTIGDVETAASTLVVSVASTNTVLLPTNNIVLGGSASNRTVTLTPVPNQSGVTEVTLTVGDGATPALRSFLVTVLPVNDLPTISVITNQIVDEDTVVGPLEFNVSDMETAPSGLVLNVMSTNTTLLPTNNIGLGGSGGNRTVTLTPLPDQSGITEVTLTVGDGVATASHTFLVTVLPVNDLPTISVITNQIVDEDTVVGPLAITIGDVETTADALVLHVASTNTVLLPTNNVVLGGVAGNRTVTLTPTPNHSGVTAVTLTVDDGAAEATHTFLLTVLPVNDLPTISAITNQVVDEDGMIGPLEFSIGDVETAADELVLGVMSTNATLLPTNNIVLGGTAGNRTVTLTPVSNQSGVTEITLTVGDGAAQASTIFVLAVLPVNDLPTISSIANQTIDEDAETGPLDFSISDAETAATALVLNVASTNNVLLPTNNVVLGGSGGNRTVTLAPATNQSGETEVTITVSDGVAETTSTFLLTVLPVNDLPTISAIANQTTDEDAVVGPLEFSIGDLETAAGELTLSVTSTNTTLLPTNNILLGGTGGNRTVTLTPEPNQSGVTEITLTVGDGAAQASTIFVLAVLPVNDLPTISSIANQTIAEDAAAGPLEFSIGDVETAAGALVLSVTSSNAAMLPTNNIALGGTDGNRTVTLTPLPNQSGLAEVTITIGDGTAETSTSFVLTVLPVNDLPTISAIANQTIDEDTVVGPLAFTVDDVETAANDLVINVMSTNTVLLPTNNIVLGGTGGNHTITLTPSSNQFGLTEVTLTVSDGTTDASSTFLITVQPVNDPPVAGTDTITRWASQGISVSIATLVANDTDVEGNALNLVSVGLPTLPGATVALTNDSVRYWPPPGSFAADEFSYEVSDGMGGLAVGLVTVQLQDEPAAFERLAIEFAGGSTLQIHLQGAAGWTYTLQSTETLSGSVWQNAGVIETDTNGEATLVLPWSPDSPAKLYRAVRGLIP